MFLRNKFMSRSLANVPDPSIFADTATPFKRLMGMTPTESICKNDLERDDY